MSQESVNTVIWQADSTNPELAERMREYLRQVIDPEIGMNIIQLGLVRDVLIDDEKVQIKMILTTPFCPYGPAMLDMTRKKAEEAVEKPATIEMGTEMWDMSMMEDGTLSNWGLY